MTKSRAIGVFDFETDPFEHGAEIKPFCGGFYDGQIYADFWEDGVSDPVDWLCTYLETRKKPMIVYAHNGGKFDFMFLLKKKKLGSNVLIINGRIVKCYVGIHELRDSYAILPVALDKFEKQEIDYAKFKKQRRNAHRVEILDYLKSDCLNLFAFVYAFVERFGTKITIGATAMHQLGKTVPIIRLDKEHDEKFRPFYFGGRVQCFEYGELRGSYKVYDVNSMYPAVMKNAMHPMGSKYVYVSGAGANKEFIKASGKLRSFGDSVYFMRFLGSHKGCLPTRTKNAGLSFEAAEGEFYACSHEIKAGVELGLIRVDEVLELHIPCSYQNFAAYVDKYSAEKIAAKAAGDKAAEQFAKLLLNSAYGKFATNPENFQEWFLRDRTDDECEQAFLVWLGNNNDLDDLDPYKAKPEIDMGTLEIWARKATPKENAYFDVACAASITSAARAVLMRAIAGAYRPIYCDTDSLICEGLGAGVPIDRAALGAWKLEEEPDTIYIAGRKLYACFKDGEPVKVASKGAKLSPQEIARLTKGEVIAWESEAPNFKMDGRTMYVKRNIRARYKIDAQNA
mgnify:CR=1 FL=1